MNYSNSKKKIVSILFAGSMLAASVMPFTVHKTYADNNFQIEKVDSTLVTSPGKKVTQDQQAKGKAQKAKSSSSLSYNIIYFLISKFIKANPLSKPR